MLNASVSTYSSECAGDWNAAAKEKRKKLFILISSEFDVFHSNNN